MRLQAILAVIVAALFVVPVACGESETATRDQVKVQPDITLLQAIDFGYVDLVQQHMEYGTDPNKVFILEGFPFAGASALHQAVLKNDPGIVRLLLENGADIEIKAKDSFQGTPLMWAAYWGLDDMAKLLLEERADVNGPDINGATPLDGASIQNPFVGKDDVDAFIENRAKIRELLSKNGGKSGI